MSTHSGSDTCIGYVAEHFHNSPQTVSVGHNQHTLSGFDGWDDGVVPVGQHAVNRDLEALNRRKLTSVLGSTSGASPRYLLSFLGCLASLSSSAGGGIS